MEFGADIHRARGFSCAECHGGDPTAGEKAAAHDRVRGYRGAPAGKEVIAVCARCHQDPTFMRRFNPAPRVDQAIEYATSLHGQRLAAGDTKVATCTSCHGAHGVRSAKDAKSPVYPLNVAATCARCHADAAHMAGYKSPSGGPLSTAQFADYQKGVHFEALTKKQDLSAPTCNDCHGNHGAVPPGVGAVAHVCGTCHTVFAERFDQSPHSAVFERGCVECHENHAIQKPSDAMLGTGKGALCGTCHEGDAGATAAQAMREALDRFRDSVDRTGQQVDALQNAGLEVGDQELAVREARTRLTLARTEMHTANLAAVEKVVNDGGGIVSEIDKAVERGFAELRFRRRGLAASMAAILLFVVALILKIRQIESHDGRTQR